MTKPESVQNAYRWALQTREDKKSHIIDLLCAKQVIDAHETSDNYDESYGKMVALVGQWERRKHHGYDKAIEVVSLLLGLDVGISPGAE